MTVRELKMLLSLVSDEAELELTFNDKVFTPKRDVGAMEEYVVTLPLELIRLERSN